VAAAVRLENDGFRRRHLQAKNVVSALDKRLAAAIGRSRVSRSALDVASDALTVFMALRRLNRESGDRKGVETLEHHRIAGLLA